MKGCTFYSLTPKNEYNYNMKIRFFLSALALVLMSNFAKAQYNACAAKSVPARDVEETYVDRATGEKKTRIVEQKLDYKSDSYGNASGNQFDLAVDGAFEGQTIVVLHLYTGENFDFEKPKAALKEKGFSVYRYINNPPSAEELEGVLANACQLWIISTTTQLLNDDHAKVIKDFFDSGKGVYIWGDNDPYHADADFIAYKLLGVHMSGYYMGNMNVGFKTDETVSGMRRDHLITTGLEYVFEGITISTIHDPQQKLTPLIWSTDGNVVTSIYEQDGKRLILDGGFTRLYCNWESAGTGRYVKNAAAWLVNYERFGDEVVGMAVKKDEKDMHK